MSIDSIKSSYIIKLLSSVSEWIVEEKISHHIDKYTRDEWQLLDEIYHQDSSAVISIGTSNLYALLGNSSKFIIFDDLMRSLGFYYQFGKPGHIGFNHLYNFVYEDSLLPNESLHQHKKWLLKKSLLLNHARYRCQYCHSFDSLSVYNCNSHARNAPWEYPLSNYKVLCPECLRLLISIETIFRNFIPNITQHDLRNILDRIHPDFDWYHPNNIEDYMSTIWPLIPHSTK